MLHLCTLTRVAVKLWAVCECSAGWARCWVAFQPRHFGHVSYTMPATTESPAAPKARWGLDRFPTPTQASAEQPARTKPQIIIIQKYSVTQKKAAAPDCGCEFLTSCSKPPSCKSSLGNYIMGECCTAALSISDSLQHYSSIIIISLDT